MEFLGLYRRFLVKGSMDYPPKTVAALESGGNAKKDRKLTIFDIFNTKVKVKVLALLADEEPLNCNQISKSLNANRDTVKRFLEVLVSRGILEVDQVFDSEFGQEYYYNRGHPKAIAIIMTFKLWEAAEP